MPDQRTYGEENEGTPSVLLFCMERQLAKTKAKHGQKRVAKKENSKRVEKRGGNRTGDGKLSVDVGADSAKLERAQRDHFLKKTRKKKGQGAFLYEAARRPTISGLKAKGGQRTQKKKPTICKRSSWRPKARR